MLRKLLILLILSIGPALSHTDHYKNISKIDMQILRNGKIVGFSNYMLNRSEVAHDLAMQPLLDGAAWLEPILGKQLPSMLSKAGDWPTC